jgi:SH3-like domain-containing protein
MMRRMIISALVIAVGLLTGATFASDAGKTTGLPVPRFVSVKAKPANVRVGPGINYPLRTRCETIGSE